VCSSDLENSPSLAQLDSWETDMKNLLGELSDQLRELDVVLNAH